MITTRINIKPAFVPMTITIETQEEADLLYVLLNMSEFTLGQVYRDLNIPTLPPVPLHRAMYNSFANVHFTR
jgi:hypothetical protein